MKFALTLGLFISLLALAPQAAHAEDDEPDLSSNLTSNDLGHGSCAAFEQAIQDYEKCLTDNKVTEGSRSGIYKCGKRPQLPPRC